jgi:hypothetical protein
VYQEKDSYEDYILYVIVTLDLNTLTSDDYHSFFETDSKTNLNSDILNGDILIIEGKPGALGHMYLVGSLIDTDKKWYLLYGVEDASKDDFNGVGFYY